MSKVDKAKIVNARRIYRAINKLQRLNRFVNVTTSSVALSRLETFILIELQAETSRGIPELKNLLGPDRSTISRALANLCKKRLLKAAVGKIDLGR